MGDTTTYTRLSRILPTSETQWRAREFRAGATITTSTPSAPAAVALIASWRIGLSTVSLAITRMVDTS